MFTFFRRFFSLLFPSSSSFSSFSFFVPTLLFPINTPLHAMAATTESLNKFFAQVDKDQNIYVDRLREVVAIPRYAETIDKNTRLCLFFRWTVDRGNVPRI